MARALATQPRLLVLDEPSTYIDRNSENHMYSLLQSLNKQCAIVLVSHDMGAVIQTVRTQHRLRQRHSALPSRHRARRPLV